MPIEPKDHVQLGNELQLFFFDPVSPGSSFFLPHGMIVYQRLEVLTPNIYDKKL